MSSKEATPLSATFSTSFLIARQTRLKMKPVLSLRTRSGSIPIRRVKASSASSVSGAVRVPPPTSTIGLSWTGR